MVRKVTFAKDPCIGVFQGNKTDPVLPLQFKIGVVIK